MFQYILLQLAMQEPFQQWLAPPMHRGAGPRRTQHTAPIIDSIEMFWLHVVRAVDRLANDMEG
jgi:hypothetical protein